MINIELQPGGENTLFGRDESCEADTIYDVERSEIPLGALLMLLKTYPFDSKAY